MRQVIEGKADWSEKTVQVISGQLGLDPDTGLLPIEQELAEHFTKLELQEQERKQKRQARLAKRREPLVIKAEFVSLLQLDRV